MQIVELRNTRTGARRTSLNPITAPPRSPRSATTPIPIDNPAGGGAPASFALDIPIPPVPPGRPKTNSGGFWRSAVVPTSSTTTTFSSASLPDPPPQFLSSAPPIVSRIHFLRDRAGSASSSSSHLDAPSSSTPPSPLRSSGNVSMGAKRNSGNIDNRFVLFCF